MGQFMRVPIAKDTVRDDRKQWKHGNQFDQEICYIRHNVLRFSQDAQLSEKAGETRSYCIRWGQF